MRVCGLTTRELYTKLNTYSQPDNLVLYSKQASRQHCHNQIQLHCRSPASLWGPILSRLPAGDIRVTGGEEELSSVATHYHFQPHIRHRFHMAMILLHWGPITTTTTTTTRLPLAWWQCYNVNTGCLTNLENLISINYFKCIRCSILHHLIDHQHCNLQSASSQPSQASRIGSSE